MQNAQPFRIDARSLTRCRVRSSSPALATLHARAHDEEDGGGERGAERQVTAGGAEHEADGHHEWKEDETQDCCHADHAASGQIADLVLGSSHRGALSRRSRSEIGGGPSVTRALPNNALPREA